MLRKSKYNKLKCGDWCILYITLNKLETIVINKGLQIAPIQCLVYTVYSNSRTFNKKLISLKKTFLEKYHYYIYLDLRHFA